MAYRSSISFLERIGQLSQCLGAEVQSSAAEKQRRLNFHNQPHWGLQGAAQSELAQGATGGFDFQLGSGVKTCKVGAVSLGTLPNSTV